MSDEILPPATLADALECERRMNAIKDKMVKELFGPVVRTIGDMMHDNWVFGCSAIEIDEDNAEQVYIDAKAWLEALGGKSDE